MHAQVSMTRGGVGSCLIVNSDALWNNSCQGTGERGRLNWHALALNCLLRSTILYTHKVCVHNRRQLAHIGLNLASVYGFMGSAKRKDQIR